MSGFTREKDKEGIDNAAEIRVGHNLRVAKYFAAGVMAIPLMLALSPPVYWFTAVLFVGRICAYFFSTFIGKAISATNFQKCLNESLLASAYFFGGGSVPVVIGMLVPDRVWRIISLLLASAGVSWFGFYRLKAGYGFGQHMKVPIWAIVLLIFVSQGLMSSGSDYIDSSF